MDVNSTETWSNNNSSEEFCFDVPLVKSEYERQAYNNDSNRAIAIDEYKTGLPLTNTQKTIQQYGSKEVVVLDETINLSDSNVTELTVERTEPEVISVIEDSELENKIIIDGRNQDDTAIIFINDNNHNTPEVVDLDGITDHENVVILNTDKKDQQNIVIMNGSRTDSDVILLDGNKTDSESTIILDDDEIFDENSLMAQLVKKCFDMENTRGMTRVIYRTLLPIYVDVKEDYKKSDALRKVLTKTIMQLDVEPEKKFSHIKNLCDEFKLHKIKKRVPFITLKDRVITDTQSTSTPVKRRKIETIIELDTEDQNDNTNTLDPAYRVKPKEYPPIEIDDSSSDVEEGVDDGDIILISKNDKENSRNTSRIKHNETERRLKTRKLAQTKNDAPTRCKNQNYRFHNEETNHHSNSYAENLNSDIIRNRYPCDKTVSQNTGFSIPSTSDPRSLLKPSIIGEYDRIAAEFNKARVQSLETKIAALKVKLEELEETEVISDSLFSPYLVCEKIKSYILTLYKELCKLTGTEMTKRHEVRLQVVAGHPVGPVRCLEEFLNSNIDKDGNPPFPDLYDVIKCVVKANVQYNMNWRSKEIMAEARALFTQYGRSMQKRRQTREYRDLMSLVKEDLPDPAEADSELQARLERNKIIGLRNENALLESYSQMESGLPDPGLRLSMQQEDSDNSGTENDISSNTAVGVPQQTCSLNTIGACENTTNFVPGRVTSINQVEPRPNTGVPCMNQVEPLNFVPGGVTFESNSGITSGLQNVSQILPFVNLNQSFISIPSLNPVHPIIGSLNQLQPVGGISSMFLVQPNSQVIMNQVAPRGLEMCVNQAVGNVGIMREGTYIGAGRPTNPEPSGVMPLNTNFGLVTGSSVTVAGGKIVIQPTVRNANDAAPVHPGSEISLYTGEHRIPINRKADPCKANDNLTVPNMTNNALQSILLESEKRNATALATGIVNLIRNGPSDKENSFANVLISNVKSVNTTESASDSCDESNDKTQTDERFFNEHTKEITDNFAISEIENETHLGKDANFENVENRRKSECYPKQRDDIDPEVPKDTTQDDSMTEESKDIVKNEPLDIPSMLEELGDDYIATIFDIEDPFLVIEISDSSESEDE